MALIACKDCGQHISERAGSCPHCGAPVLQPTTNTRDGASSGNTTKTVVTGLAAWLISTWVAKALFGIVAVICLAYFLTHSA